MLRVLPSHLQQCVIMEQSHVENLIKIEHRILYSFRLVEEAFCNRSAKDVTR